jgi:hypothetical protein
MTVGQHIDAEKEQALREMGKVRPITWPQVRKWNIFLTVQPMQDYRLHSYQDRLIFSEGGWWKVFFDGREERFADILDAMKFVDNEQLRLFVNRVMRKIENERVQETF